MGFWGEDSQRTRKDADLARRVASTNRFGLKPFPILSILLILTTAPSSPRLGKF